jgi:hypothetical protein
MTNRPEDVMQWDEAVRHLVRAHGADARRLEAYALPLGQLRWVHFDTHAALDIAQARPPDGHVHPALPDPGRPGSPDQGYRPFPTAPGAAGGLADWRQPRFMAMRRHTGLPQTEANPGFCWEPDLDLTGRWAAQAISQWSTAHPLAVSTPRLRLEANADPAQVLARFRSELRDLAGAVAARWLIRSNFPAAPLTAPDQAARQPGHPGRGHRARGHPPPGRAPPRPRPASILAASSRVPRRRPTAGRHAVAAAEEGPQGRDQRPRGRSRERATGLESIEPREHRNAGT